MKAALSRLFSFIPGEQSAIIARLKEVLTC
jgi:hypothetical protein